MDAGPVGEQPEPAGAPALASQRAQERVSIGLTSAGADQHHPASGSQVNRPKKHAFGIAAGDRHHRLSTLEGPGMEPMHLLQQAPVCYRPLAHRPGSPGMIAPGRDLEHASH